MKRPSRLVSWGVVSVLTACAGVGLLVSAGRSIGRLAYGSGHASWRELAGLLAASLVFDAISVGAGGLAGVELSVRLRRRTFEHALVIDPDQVETMGAGTALAKSMDAELVGSFLVTTAPSAVLGVIEVIGGLALSSLTDDGALRAAIVVTGLVLLGAQSRLLLRARRDWAGARTVITDDYVERLVGQRTVALQGRGSQGRSPGLLDRYGSAGRRLDRAELGLTASVTVVSAVLFVLAFVADARGRRGSDVALALGSALLVTSGLAYLTRVVDELVSARIAADGVDDLGAKAALPVEPPRSAPVGTVVAAESLALRYSNGRQIFADLALSVAGGERVLLTGPSGSGKTSLVEVLAGRRSPTSGQVLTAPGAVIARVPQAGDDHLLKASLLFNVIAGVDWPPSEQQYDDAVEVLHDLGLGPLLERMPSGVLQPVGDGGWRLSSGEAARVRLARALVRRPDLLIVDEAFAPLDAGTLAVALAAAEKWSDSVLVVAHT